MRWLRSALVLAVVLVLGTIAVLAYLGSSTERSVATLKGIVAYLSPYTLEVTGAKLSWQPFHFEAGLILLRYQEPGTPPLVSLQEAELETPLYQLLTGSVRDGHFRARNISYYLDESETEGELNAEALLAPLGLLPASVTIGSVHVISKRTDLWVFPLQGVEAYRDDENYLVTRASADFGRRHVSLDTRTRWELSPGRAHTLSVAGSLAGTDGRSKLSLDGSIRAKGPDLSYELDIFGEYASVSDFVAAFSESAFPFSGDLRVAGSLRGDLDGFALQIDDLALHTDDEFEFAATGSLQQNAGDAVTLDLEARGDADRIDRLLPLPDSLRRHLKRSELQLGITGTVDQPRLSHAELVLYGSGDARVELASDNQNLNFEDLQALDFSSGVDARFSASIGDLNPLLADDDTAEPTLTMSDLNMRGTLRWIDDRLEIAVDALTGRHAELDVSAQGFLLWQGEELSMPRITATAQAAGSEGELRAEGAIADLPALRGVALRVSSDRLPIQAMQSFLDSELPSTATDLALSGNLLLLKAADPWRFNELDLQLLHPGGLTLTATGESEWHAPSIEADLQLALEASDTTTAYKALGIPLGPQNASARIRLRDHYATFIANGELGNSDVQLVASADLENQVLTQLSVDTYSQQIHLDDFAPAFAPQQQNLSAEQTTPEELRNELPDFPLQLTFRADKVLGAGTELEAISVHIDETEQRFLLRHLDARYDGGALMMRGVVDLAAEPAQISLAGQGIRVPLATLTRDLGLQEEISGDLSVRGGLSAVLDETGDWQSTLQGRVALAVNDARISGAAYDLLMSNLLAWVVQGAGEKTTTFDCTMAQFDVAAGQARSDSLYMETPRMLATGKAHIDLPGNTLDVRLEPRSKTRAFQFPSAVNFEGALDDPQLRITPLQTVADVSAQALLLLPSLTLKLFGIGAGDERIAPCQATL